MLNAWTQHQKDEWSCNGATVTSAKLCGNSSVVQTVSQSVYWQSVVLVTNNSGKTYDEHDIFCATIQPKFICILLLLWQAPAVGHLLDAQAYGLNISSRNWEGDDSEWSWVYPIIMFKFSIGTQEDEFKTANTIQNILKSWLFESYNTLNWILARLEVSDAFSNSAGHLTLESESSGIAIWIAGLCIHVSQCRWLIRGCAICRQAPFKNKFAALGPFIKDNPHRFEQ